MNKMQERYKRLHEMDLDDLVEYTYNLEQNMSHMSQMSHIKINELLIKTRSKYFCILQEINIFNEKINELLENKSVDAILAVNELFAVTALKLAMANGIKIPEDLSVVAFTDGIISKYSTPTITTISQNGIKMGLKWEEKQLKC